MRRRLLIIAIFLLAGVVVNVVVAWGCALRTGTSNDEELLSTAAKSEWVQFIEYRRNVRPGVLSAVSCRGLDVITIEGIAARGLTGPVVAQRCRAGWPILGMRGEKVAHLVAGSNTVKSARFYAAIPIGQARKAFFHNTPEILPFRPIWPGFAFDTIFYAAILWPLIIGPFALRRLIRRRRGLCPACGYDLRHAEHEACPECGNSS